MLASLAAPLALQSGAAPPDRKAPGAEGLAARLDRIFGAKDIAEAEIGVSVVEASTQERLYERNADQPLSLASNTKLVTTACALERLGPDFRFETTLSRRGPISGDVLEGDLVVRGSGDPTIGARLDGEADGVLRRFARALREAGVRRVTGALIADDRLFDREHQHPDWPRDQLDRWYAAPVSALTLNDGCVDITVAPGARPGEPAVVTMAPRSSILELELRCGTTADRKQHVLDVGRRPGVNRYVVRGSVLASSEPVTTSICVVDPALVFATVLKERLLDEGVSVEGAARVSAPAEKLEGLVPLATHCSLLAESLPVVNKRSQNNTAEQILKALGAAAGGAGTWAAATAVETEFLASLGIVREKISLVDGSGLARGNKLPAGAVATLLGAMARGRNGSCFMASLAVAGQDGTLEKRLRAPSLARRVFAKTGTINAVSALSGYVVPRAPAAPGVRGGVSPPRAEAAGAPPAPPSAAIAFSILINKCPGGAARARQVQDEAVEAIAGFLDERAAAEAGTGRSAPEGAGGGG